MQKNKLISMSTLGSNGRFGNQFFQYIFLRLYSKLFDCKICTPKWIGQEIFNINDLPIIDKFPLVEMPNTEIPCWIDKKFKNLMPLVNVDFHGYFQYNTKYINEYKSYIREIFTPKIEIKSKLSPIINTLKKLDKTIIGIHLRNGDFGHLHHFIPPNSWYKEWLDSFWSDIKNPLLFIASDELEKNIVDFKKYKPITSYDLGINDIVTDYYSDFYMLSKCDMLAISNSTFSFAASMLNDKGSVFMRPRLSQNKLIKYDPWQSVSNFKDEKFEDYHINQTKSNRNKPQISVLISAYNAEKYLKVAIESIKRQSYKNFEVIIINDNSTDNTLKVLNFCKDDRFKIISNEQNMGLTKSLNIGLKYCNGKYIARMDADDFSIKDRLFKQICFLDSNQNISLLGTSYYKINHNNKVIDIINVPLTDKEIKYWLLSKCPFGHGTVMMRREVLENAGGYDERFLYAQDFDLWLRLSEKFNFANLKEPLYCWRLTKGCISHAKAIEQRKYHNFALSEANKRKL
jgi:hypothetical protein